MRGLDIIGARGYMVWRNRIVQMSRCGAHMFYTTECCECGNYRCLLTYRVIDGCNDDVPLLSQKLDKNTNMHTYLGDEDTLESLWTDYALYQLEMAGEL